jgi:hypothetical protein
MRAIFLLLILTIPTVAQRSDAVLVGQVGSPWCEDFRSRLDNFLADLLASPGWQGVVIGYEGNYTDYRPSKPKIVRPVLGEVNTRVHIIRRHIEFRAFDPSRVIFISGGFREDHQFEFYKVPPGGKFPIAKPTLTSIKYRRGKPTPLIGC